MDIIFSANNNEEIMVFPVVPPDTGPAVPQEHEDFEAITGKMKIIGNMGLRSLSIESFWPVDKNYPWVRPGSDPNGWLYVEFFEKWREKFQSTLPRRERRKVLPGLTKRRQAERQLFLTPDKKQEVENEMVQNGKVIVDGKEVPVRLILKDGTNYISVRDIGKAIGYDVSAKGNVPVLSKR